MVEGDAGLADDTLPWPASSLLLISWYNVWPPLLASHALYFVRTAWCSAIASASCCTNHALWVVTWSSPWVSANNGPHLPSSLLNYFISPPSALSSSFFNHPPPLCKLTAWCVGAENHCRVSTRFKPRGLLPGFHLPPTLLLPAPSSVDRPPSCCVSQC